MSTTTWRVWRGHAGSPLSPADDVLATEAPLEIRIGGRRLAITMRTPGHDADLALGLLHGEGIVGDRTDVTTLVQPEGGPGRNVLDVQLAPHVPLDLERFARHVMVTSACGLCGAPSIDAVHRHLPPLPAGARLDPDVLLSLPAALEQSQPAFRASGGLHAAALFTLDGALVVAREDVGRHNAVDKVVGWGLREGRLPFSEHVLVVSGRASFEIAQKALAARLPIVAAVSAPSSAAVALAEDAEQTLVGFLRPPGFTVYAHPTRLRRSESPPSP